MTWWTKRGRMLRCWTSQEIPGHVPVKDKDSYTTTDPVYFAWNNWRKPLAWEDWKSPDEYECCRLTHHVPRYTCSFYSSRVPEVFIDPFEAGFLSRQCSSSKNRLQVNPAPLNGIQIEQVLIQVWQTKLPKADLDRHGINLLKWIHITSIIKNSRIRSWYNTLPPYNICWSKQSINSTLF